HLCAHGGRNLRHFRGGRHLRAGRSSGRGTCCASNGTRGRASLDANHPARSACHVFRHARRRRRLGRTACHRSSPPAAHRSVGGRGVLLRGAEGLLCHA